MTRTTTGIDTGIATALGRGLVIPACPLALTASRRLDERRQRALVRYYFDAGAGGLAVGVHTSQFAIRDPRYGLFRPLLELAAEEMDRADLRGPGPAVRIGGACGRTAQATAEASMLREAGFHAALLSLGALADASEAQMLAHSREVGEIIPLVGFYLQPRVGGRDLPYSFWRRFVEIPSVVAIKVAPFDRYRTLDVVRALDAAGRGDVALYTGNDDNIVLDLLTPYRFGTGRGARVWRMVGGLLGQWAVWTRRAVDLLAECRELAASGRDVPAELLGRHAEITDANAAIFDAAHGFRGCIAGVHEVLRRQGLLEGIWCLDPEETLSPGQSHEIDRVLGAYPHLRDDAFVRENLDDWLRP